jgi:hypothetical protein
LEGEAHEWWYHGLVKLGHSRITSYREFTDRLMDRFDRKDPEIHFRYLAQLRQTRIAEAFITEFQRVVVAVTDISKPRLIMLFTGLSEPLRGWVKAYKPPTLQDAILRTRDLADSVPKTKTFSKPFLPQRDRDRKPFQIEWKGKEKLDDQTRGELMRKKLFFSCRDPWVSGHRCMGKGEIHYIQVVADNVDSEEEEQDSGSTSSEEESTPAKEQPPHRPLTPVGAHPLVVPQLPKQANRRKPTKGGVIATLSGVPRYDTLRIRGIIQGQRAIALIDGGATHNFIDTSLVLRQALQTRDFEGFDVAVADGHTVECLDRVPNLEMKLGNYAVRDTFYVVDLSDTDVVLGVQWMITLGKITTNNQTLEMGFRD